MNLLCIIAFHTRGIKMLKPVPVKRSGKQEREVHVLLGLVEYYLKTGTPVGSDTLKVTGFDHLSSATIRNYFANLEQEGYLKQLHASGGRIPTEKAYKVYAENALDNVVTEESITEQLKKLKSLGSREIASYLQQAAELISQLTHTAVFMSAPRFDQDFILEAKLVNLDAHRCACLVLTNFGLVKTEILHSEFKLTAFSTKRMEQYFHWRLTGLDKPENLEKEEERLAQKFYNEVLVRYVVGYSHFIDEEIYRTGFSHLLHYREFDDIIALTSTLSLMEQMQSLRLLLRECVKIDRLKYWIGTDLLAYSNHSPECSVIAVPYHIHNQPVGAFGVLGPMRLPYRELFATLQLFSKMISEALTESVYKFKINYRQPKENAPFPLGEKQLLGQSGLILLEDKTEKI